MAKRARLACVNRHRMYFAALLISGPPVYSGKYFSIDIFGSLTLKMSILLRKRMIDVRKNHRLLTTDSNNTKDSSIRFCPASSKRTWSYSLSATQKMMLVTASKQWIHFFLSDRCPPTSNILIDRSQLGAKDWTLDFRLTVSIIGPLRILSRRYQSSWTVLARHQFHWGHSSDQQAARTRLGS